MKGKWALVGDEWRFLVRGQLKGVAYRLKDTHGGNFTAWGVRIDARLGYFNNIEEAKQAVEKSCVKAAQW